MFVEVIGKKLVGGAFLPLPHPANNSPALISPSPALITPSSTNAFPNILANNVPNNIEIALFFQF